MINDEFTNAGLNESQRYYRRNKEKLKEKRRAKYHNNPDVKKREIELAMKWNKEHPYEFSITTKRYRLRKKLKDNQIKNVDTNKI